ncbi:MULTISPECIES: hypothetical protein [unclassified Microcoleus]|uniref:hypothetical protein n=1 Tax=unclassified Microcoleus TaxID=2642155 RepID=UPI002FD2A62B
MRYAKKCRRPYPAQFEQPNGKRNYWTRTQLKELLGQVGKKKRKNAPAMSEGSFKRRLALLEECPEAERAIYTRQFSDFTKWCLVRIQEIFLNECDRNLERTRTYLKEKGLETDEYFAQ